MLRRIFWPKSDEIIWVWRKLYKGQLHNSYSLPNINRMNKSRGIILGEHASRKWENKNT
jgi:hypothetical protein